MDNIGVILFDTKEPNWRRMFSPVFVKVNKEDYVIDILIQRILKSEIDNILIATRKSETEEIHKKIEDIKERYGADICLNTSLSGLLNDLFTKYKQDKLIFFIPEEPLVDWDIINYGINKTQHREIARYDGYIVGSAPRIIKGEYADVKVPESISWKDINNIDFLLYNSAKNKNLISNLKNEDIEVMLQISDTLKLSVFLKLIKKGLPIKDNLYSIVEFLKKPEIKKEVFRLFKNVRLKTLEKCEFCGGVLINLDKPVTQPVIGFLFMDESYYKICNNCGLVVLNPRVVDNELGDLYDKNYTNNRVGLRFPANLLDICLKYAKQENGKLLDVGGSIGDFCIEFKKHKPKWNVDLIDISSEAVEIAKNRGVNAFVGDICKSNLEKDYYDLITMWEVIEHIPIEKGIKMFNKIYSLLTPGGIFLFSTPNYDSFLSRVFDEYHDAVPFHIYVFSESFLKKFIKKTLFSTIDIKITNSVDLTGWTNYLARSTSSKQLRKLAEINLNMLLNKEPEAENYLKRVSEFKGSTIVGICKK